MVMDWYNAGDDGSVQHSLFDVVEEGIFDVQVPGNR